MAPSARLAKAREASTTFAHLVRGRSVLASCACLALAATVALGVGLRLAHPYYALFWNDEVWSAIVSTGHSFGGAIRLTSAPRLLAASDFTALERYQPGADFGAFLRTDPHTSPLFYALCFGAIRLTGDPVRGTRLLAAALGCLALLAIYLAARRLFRKASVGLAAAAIAAVSPMQLYMSYEARPYVLWLGTTAFATYAFLRAHQAPPERAGFAWRAYAFAAALLMYSHLYGVFTIAAHVAYAAISPATTGDTWRRLRGAMLGLALALAPWVVVIVVRFRLVSELTGWLKQPLPLGESMRGFGTALLWQFTTYENLPHFELSRALCIAMTVGVVALVAYQWWRMEPREVAALLTLLLLALPAFLLATDLLHGGRRFGVVRYYVSSFLALTFGVASLAARAAGRLHGGALRGRLLAGCALGLVVLLLASSIVGARTMFASRVPDGKPDGCVAAMGEEIAQARGAVLLNPGLVTMPLILSNLLPAETNILDLREHTLERQVAEIKAVLSKHPVYLLRMAPPTIQFEPRRSEAERMERALGASFRLEAKAKSCCLVQVLEKTPGLGR